MADLCTLQDVKDRLNKSDTQHDALLSLLITAASDHVRGYTGQSFTQATETRTYPWDGRSKVVDTGYVSNVTAVAVGGVALSADHYYVSRGQLYIVAPYVWPRVPYRSVTVTATFGEYNATTNEQAPASVRDVVAGWAARRWKQTQSGLQATSGNDELGRPIHEVRLTPEDYRILDLYRSESAVFA